MRASVMSLSGSWSDCSPDVLARCFSTQADYTDNCAAACVCKSWLAAFRNCAEEFSFYSNSSRACPFPATYMRQFQNLSKICLARDADWQPHSQNWLTPPVLKYTWSPEEHDWGKATVQNLPPSCRHLTLDCFLPSFARAPPLFDQLPNLCKLHIHAAQATTIDLACISHAQRLQELILAGSNQQSIWLWGSLSSLPASLRRLEMTYCAMASCVCINHVVHSCTEHLTLSFITIRFGEEVTIEMNEDIEAAIAPAPEVDRLTQETWSQATSLITLVLEGSDFLDPEHLVNALRRAPKLQKLILRKTSVLTTIPGSIHELLLLPSLQALDITDCPRLQIFQHDLPDRGLHLQSFFFDYNQLHSSVQPSFLQSLMQSASHDLGKPVLGLEGQFPHFGYQHWMNRLPLTLLTHLTIFDAHKWPIAFFLNGKNNALPNLQVLEVSFASLVSSDMDGITFPADSKLKELYVSGTTCSFVDLSACISLVSLGIIHRGHEAPAMYLPTTLQKLYLHNVLRQDVVTDWLCLCSLTFLKLGGRAAKKDALRALPELSEKLLDLDLWDGCVTTLDNLSILTNLKKLSMPSAPSPEQLAAIKQLRQLRHIEVTTHAGEPSLQAVAVQRQDLMAVLLGSLCISQRRVISNMLCCSCFANCCRATQLQRFMRALQYCCSHLPASASGQLQCKFMLMCTSITAGTAHVYTHAFRFCACESMVSDISLVACRNAHPPRQGCSSLE